MIFICLSVCLSSLIVAQGTQSGTEAADVIQSASSIEWLARVPGQRLVLTVSGPDGVYLKQGYPAGAWPRFEVVDDEGRLRAWR